MKHILKAAKELVLEVKLLLIDDGSNAPSLIPFVWERTGMNFRKKESNKRAVKSLKKNGDDVDPDLVIELIKKINFSETLDKIKNNYTDKSILDAINERSIKIEERTKLIKQHTITFIVTKTKVDNDAAIINKLRGELSTLHVDVSDSDTGHKTKIIPPNIL